MYLVVECEFNRANYPDLIGIVYEEPPSYAIVKVLKGNEPEIATLNGKLYLYDCEGKIVENCDEQDKISRGRMLERLDDLLEEWMK